MYQRMTLTSLLLFALSEGLNYDQLLLPFGGELVVQLHVHDGQNPVVENKYQKIRAYTP